MRKYTDKDTVGYLEKEYDRYNSKNRRKFYIDDEEMLKFRGSMQLRKEKELIDDMQSKIKHGYISQHWK